MAYVSHGRRLMAFSDGTAIAFATNHALNINAVVLEDRTKDDGDAPVGEFDNYDWGVTSDHIVGVNDPLTTEQSVVDLIDKMLALNTVDLAFDAAKPATGSVPTTGWEANGVANDYPATSGTAWIESISINAGSTGYATLSVSFKGDSDLS